MGRRRNKMQNRILTHKKQTNPKPMVSKKHKIREWCRLIMLVFTANVNRLKFFIQRQKDIKWKKKRCGLKEIH